jgi:hypothetical protein
MSAIDEPELSLGASKDLDRLKKDKSDQVDAEEFIAEIITIASEPA